MFFFLTNFFLVNKMNEQIVMSNVFDFANHTACCITLIGTNLFVAENLSRT